MLVVTFPCPTASATSWRGETTSILAFLLPTDLSAIAADYAGNSFTISTRPEPCRFLPRGLGRCTERMPCCLCLDTTLADPTHSRARGCIALFRHAVHAINAVFFLHC
jgi:hypothetical protein